MDSKLTKHLNQLESLIQSRSIPKAKSAIVSLLRKHPGHDELIFRACDAYRRLGLYREGFQLLEPREPLQRRVSTKNFEGQRLLWAARFLMAMGAHEYALALARFLEMPEHSEDLRILGNIHLLNWDARGALPFFERMRSLWGEPRALPYSSRIALLSLADSLFSSGEREEATALALEILKHSTEPLLQALSHSALGEYAARQGRFQDSLNHFKKADPLFPSGDSTPDRAVFLKWRGYAHGKEDRLSLARADFDASFGLLFQPSLRPEGFLDVLRLRREIEHLSPSDEARLIHYPGLPAGFRALLPSLQSMLFNPDPGPSKPKIVIHLNSEEHQIHGRWKPGLPLELRLLGLLRITGDWGMNLLRAQSLLWPQEAFSFLQLEGRLRSLVHRLRNHYRIPIQVSGKTVKIPPTHLQSIQVLASGPSRPSFLRDARIFSAREVSRHWILSDAQSSREIAAWKERGWIRPAEGRRWEVLSP